METSELNHDAYTVAWVVTLDCELNAARSSLDSEHGNLLADSEDPNSYFLGKIGAHSVVIVLLATEAVTNMTRKFRNIRLVLVLGIGGGAPAAPHLRSAVKDIRLGDVVVSYPHGEDGGIVDLEKNKSTYPPPWLLSRVGLLGSYHRLSRIKESKMLYLCDLQAQIRGGKGLHSWIFPGRAHDKLFKSDSQHVGGDGCSQCNQGAVLTRLEREIPVVHHGLIASGSQFKRSAEIRDALRAQRNILCYFETDVTVLMDNYPCLVIIGISDYADSHKNDLWKGYAAITSAAYAKDLLRLVG
ncbi:nucleoside phosphorylase domain-containing protein [Aspergillus keveii]|uniref:Nucleoside phosphorylase domain-containing protein n=1 Tax=Aspergillus keveii TaxID=714993 RepID=A0ABR4FHF0_9EURO